MKKNSRVSRPGEALARYPIRAVSKLTGISIDTLRSIGWASSRMLPEAMSAGRVSRSALRETREYYLVCRPRSDR